MSLVEIARFQDVYEADLAAAFLASHDVEVSVTERFQTTLDSLMQRALGIRLMVPDAMADQARDLLACAQSGEFAAEDGDDLPARSPRTWAVAALMAIAAYFTGGFWGVSLPRRFRPVSLYGIIAASLLFLAGSVVVLTLTKMLLDPP